MRGQVRAINTWTVVRTVIMAAVLMTAAPAFSEPDASKAPVRLSLEQLDQVTAGGRTIIATASASAEGEGRRAKALVDTQTFANGGNGRLLGWASSKAFGSGSDNASASASFTVLSDTLWATGTGSADATNGGTASVNTRGGIFDTRKGEIAISIVISIAHGTDAQATADAATGSVTGTGATQTIGRLISRGNTTIAISKSITVLQ